MNNLTRKSVILLTTFFLAVLLSVDGARPQESSDPSQLPVDIMQVLELPVHISGSMLLRSEQGYGGYQAGTESALLTSAPRLNAHDLLGDF
jgi:hypothetical protein